VELGKVRRETGAYKQFVVVTEQIVQVNGAICEARPVPPGAAGSHIWQRPRSQTASA
jgi:hypothetical protein